MELFIKKFDGSIFYKHTPSYLAFAFFKSIIYKNYILLKWKPEILDVCYRNRTIEPSNLLKSSIKYIKP